MWEAKSKNIKENLIDLKFILDFGKRLILILNCEEFSTSFGGKIDPEFKFSFENHLLKNLNEEIFWSKSCQIEPPKVQIEEISLDEIFQLSNSEKKKIEKEEMKKLKKLKKKKKMKKLTLIFVQNFSLMKSIFPFLILNQKVFI